MGRLLNCSSRIALRYFVLCLIGCCTLATAQVSVPHIAPQGAAQLAMPAQITAWELLTKAYTSTKTSARVDAISALSTVDNNARALGLVESALADKSPEVRAQAANSLAEMNSQRSIPKLKELLKDSSPEVAFAAARALSQLGDPSGRDILIEVLTGDRRVSGGLVDSGVSWAKQMTPGNLIFLGAAQGASMFVGPVGTVGVSAVRQLIGDKSAPARVTSAQALAPDGSQRAIEILAKALHDKNWTVRFAAANALGFAPTTEPVSQLEPLLRDKKFPVRLVTAASIVRLTTPAPPTFDAGGTIGLLPPQFPQNLPQHP